MTKRIAVVVDPWDFPFNGTVVSSRRFVSAMEVDTMFQVLSCETVENKNNPQLVGFQAISLPGFNGLLRSMKVPLAKPDKSRIRSVLKNCDLVHVQFPFFLGFSVIREALLMAKPVVCSFHVQPENLLHNVGIRSSFLTKLLYKLFLKYFYNRADLVIAPSQFAADLLKQHGLKKPVTVISNGVPEVFFKPHQAPSKQGFKLVSVGRLAKEKQQRILLEAVAASTYKNQIYLSLIGTGPMETSLKALMSKLGIRGRVGSVSDLELAAAYASADLFVHAGDIELEGMSVMEAMAAGNAVLISDSPESAARELIKETAARFRHGDSEHLADKIDALLADPAKRRELAVVNRSNAERRRHGFSVLQLGACYDDLLDITPQQSRLG